jgi:hypothetical protein
MKFPQPVKVGERTLAQARAATDPNRQALQSGVMGRILRRLKQVRFLPFGRSELGVERGRSTENPDSLAARGGREGGPSSAIPTHGAPPGYVPGADEGRPRH